MSAERCFRVKRDFHSGQTGDVKTTSQLAGCDIPWMVEVGTLEPMQAGGVPIMSLPAGAPDLSEYAAAEGVHPAAGMFDTLTGHIEGLHATLTGALELAAHRSQQLAAACEENGRHCDDLAAANKRIAELERQLDESRAVTVKWNTQQQTGPTGYVAGVFNAKDLTGATADANTIKDADGNQQATGAKPNQPAPEQPKKLPVPDEAAKTKTGKK